MAVLETERLLLRELIPGGRQDLADILQDPLAMQAYEGPFDDDGVDGWLERQLARYREFGIGLWAVIRKEDGVFVGQCGLSWQDAGGQDVLEIGYLFKRVYWHNGYAAEAARGCKKYAFEALHADRVCSIIRDTNTASIHVAERNGMVPTSRFTKHYRGVDMPHIVYCVTREMYEKALGKA